MVYLNLTCTEILQKFQLLWLIFLYFIKLIIITLRHLNNYIDIAIMFFN